jgi:hypothetical protein
MAHGNEKADDVAARFVRAIVAKDVPAMKAVLAPDIDFRGLTPAEAWRATSPDEVVEIVLGSWFEPEDEVRETLEMSNDPVADRHRLRYRFRVESDGESFLVEQQGYLDAADGRITRLTLVCSGFRTIHAG